LVVLHGGLMSTHAPWDGHPEPAPESFEGFATAQGGPTAELAPRIKLDHKAQGADGWKTAPRWPSTA